MKRPQRLRSAIQARLGIPARDPGAELVQKVVGDLREPRDVGEARLMVGER